MEFELRCLKSDDLFSMFTILSKIGFKDIKGMLTPDSVKDLVKAFKESEQDDKTDEQDDIDFSTIVGFNMMFEVLDILMRNLPVCKNDVYSFLASLSGMGVSEIADLEMVTFTEMVIAVVQKEEFKDFFKAVAKLFK